MADDHPKAQLGVLEEPTRRRLYELVREHGEPTSREHAARALAISRTLAAYHLDKLVENGLLTTEYRRGEGRTGPGAGRPAKLYSPSAQEIVVSVPARDYAFAADLLAEALEGESSAGARDELRLAAHGRGVDEGASLREATKRQDLMGILAQRGYEPYEDEGGTIRLRNCPFDRLAGEHREVVCGMNEAFTQGLLEGLGRDDVVAALDPAPGRCCVAIGAPG